jgi:hypothetical protein
MYCNRNGSASNFSSYLVVGSYCKGDLLVNVVYFHKSFDWGVVGIGV